MGNIPNLPKISKKTPENEKSKMFHFFLEISGICRFHENVSLFFGNSGISGVNFSRRVDIPGKKCLHSKKLEDSLCFLGLWGFGCFCSRLRSDVLMFWIFWDSSFSPTCNAGTRKIKVSKRTEKMRLSVSSARSL